MALNDRAKDKDNATQEEKKIIENAKKEVKDIEEAETNGAAWAFRWVSVLPCALVLVFGLIAFSDRIRGGYQAVHITDGKPGGAGPIAHAPSARSDGVKGAGGIQT